jgi:integrase
MLQRGNTRILTPTEYELVLAAIPKADYKTMFEALMWSGMRYIEFRRLKSNPKLFNGRTVYVKSTKALTKQVDRTVHLNSAGRTAMRYFLQTKLKPPTQATWIEDLKRWAKIANLDTDSNGESLMGSKTTRKTLESWLIKTYPDKIFDICMSQGHTELTSLKYYANLDFTPEDKRDMKKYVEGWE